MEGGWSGEAASVVHENCFADLKKPVKRLCTVRTGIPYGPVFEREIIPNEPKIVDAIKTIMK